MSDFLSRIELIEGKTGWSPCLSLDDAKKLDAVRVALRSGDVAAASKLGHVFKMQLVAE